MFLYDVQTLPESFRPVEPLAECQPLNSGASKPAKQTQVGLNHKLCNNKFKSF